MSSRPKNEKELQKREAVGVIRASRFVRLYSRSHKPINIEAINLIHKEIFKDAWPEIAGKYRKEEIEITGSAHQPPHSSRIPEMMITLDKEMKNWAEECKLAEGFILDFDDNSRERFEAIDKIFNFAAIMHHKITFIHPYVDGNGRTARLAANLILERYGLVGLSVKIERADKDRYRKCLAQADKGDYELLLNLIAEGLVERYGGVPLKFYSQE